MMQTPPRRPKLQWIECLRGLAVMTVVCHHLLVSQLAHRIPTLLPYYDFGVFGVIVFFCISGFIIPYSVLGIRESPGIGFPVARFFRLYPAYWLSLLFAIWAFHPATKLLLINLTMTQRFIGDKDINGVYWTLQVELIFYVVFELLILTRRVLSTHLYPLLTLTFALTAVGMGAIRHFLNLKAPLSPPAGLTVMFLATTYFMHLNYALWTRTRLVIFSIVIYGLLCLSFALGYSKDWGYSENPARFCTMYLAGVLSFLLFQWINARSKMLAFLGRISYPVYLFHVPIATLVAAYLLARIGFRACVSLDFVLFGIVATIVHYTVEKPFVRLGRRTSLLLT